VHEGQIVQKGQFLLYTVHSTTCARSAQSSGRAAFNVQGTVIEYWHTALVLILTFLHLFIRSLVHFLTFLHSCARVGKKLSDVTLNFLPTRYVHLAWNLFRFSLLNDRWCALSFFIDVFIEL